MNGTTEKRNRIRFRVMALFAVASGIVNAGTFYETTGYATLVYGGKNGESPLNSQKVSRSSADSTQVFAWSDEQWPHSTTNYYAGKQFRSPNGEFSFDGGKLVIGAVALWSSTKPATFENGIELAENAVLRNNVNTHTSTTRINGSVFFSANCRVQPSGQNYYSTTDESTAGFKFYGDASSGEDVTVTVEQRQATYWGWFGLLGRTDGFLGTLVIDSCAYEMGIHGLPNGTLRFSGTNTVLSLPAVASDAVPAVKSLAFGSDGPYAIRVQFDGDHYGRVRVIDSFSAETTVTIEAPAAGNLVAGRRMEILRAPKGMLSRGRFAVSTLLATPFMLSLDVEEDGSDDVLVMTAREYVSMQYGGKDGDSPLTSQQVYNDDDLVNAWSDDNAPTDTAKAYYAKSKMFRTPVESANTVEFGGGRLVLDNSTVLWKTVYPGRMSFPNGLDIIGGTQRMGVTSEATVTVEGPVYFSGNTTVNPAGSDGKPESRIEFCGTASSDDSATITVKQQSGDRRGFFSLSGATCGFYGTINIVSNGYEMGSCGLPNGTITFSGANAVLAVPVLSGSDASTVKNMTFDCEESPLFKIACDGGAYSKVRILRQFAITGAKMKVALTILRTGGATPKRLEVLRAPKGSFDIGDFEFLPPEGKNRAITWTVEDSGDEQSLVARGLVTGFAIIFR